MEQENRREVDCDCRQERQRQREQDNAQNSEQDSSTPAGPQPDDTMDEHSDCYSPMDVDHVTLSRYAQEGGVRLLNYLLNRALPTLEAYGNLEMHHKDIVCLPVSEQKEWYSAEHDTRGIEGA